MTTRKNWVLVYEDAAGAAGGAGTDPNAGGGSTETMLPQSKVNAILAAEKRKFQEQQQKTIAQLEVLKKEANLTQQQRDELQNRIEQLQSETLTKEQLAQRQLAEAEKKGKEALSGLEKERDVWRGMYTRETIQRSIADAAVINEAFQPKQIVALLESKCKLLENVGADGRPNGSFTPKVEFEDTDKDGKPVVLTLTVTEAVKRMKELPDTYGNLFKSKATGGVGGITADGVRQGAVDMNDHQAYLKARKADPSLAFAQRK